MISDRSPLFSKALDYVLRNEGGYVWNKNDAGGPTNFGITQADLSAWRKQASTPLDVKNLSLEETENIYMAWYWKPLSLEHVRSLGIAICILDTGVLFGTHVGATFAQKTAKNLGKDLEVDGQLGPLSVEALNALDVKAFIEMYVSNIFARIEEIVHAYPRDAVFLVGWENRTRRLLTLV